MTLTCASQMCGKTFEADVSVDAVSVGDHRRTAYHVPRYCPACRAAFERDLELDREEIQRRRAS